MSSLKCFVHTAVGYKYQWLVTSKLWHNLPYFKDFGHSHIVAKHSEYLSFTLKACLIPICDTLTDTDHNF